MPYAHHIAEQFSPNVKSSMISDAFSRILRESFNEVYIDNVIERNEAEIYKKSDMNALHEFFSNDELADCMGGAFLAILGRSFVPRDEDDAALISRACRLAKDRQYRPEPDEDCEPTADEIAKK